MVGGADEVGAVAPLVQQDPEGAQTLVRRVGGLPLALTLMGKYLAAQAFTGQPRRLQAALAQRPGGDVAEHRLHRVREHRRDDDPKPGREGRRHRHAAQG